MKLKVRKSLLLGILVLLLVDVLWVGSAALSRVSWEVWGCVQARVHEPLIQAHLLGTGLEARSCMVNFKAMPIDQEYS